MTISQHQVAHRDTPWSAGLLLGGNTDLAYDVPHQVIRGRIGDPDCHELTGIGKHAVTVAGADGVRLKKRSLTACP